MPPVQARSSRFFFEVGSFIQEMYVKRKSSSVRLISFIFFIAVTLTAQTGGSWLKGQVTDPSGAVVVQANITVKNSSGQIFTAASNRQGAYEIKGLTPGKYTLIATSAGFTPYELTDVDVPADGQTLDVQLGILVEKQQVTVEDQGTSIDVSSAANNASATVIKGKDLEALSDDPDELQGELDALAGPSAGPNGGQIYIDGFTNGQLPPKNSIREIRVNQNPFSAQFDSLGYGRVEVFTKPGMDSYHGQLMFMDNNSVLNSKSPFAPNQPDYNTRMINGNISGPLGKKASFFFDVSHRNINDVSVINAIDPVTLQPLNATVLSPRTRWSIGPRIDYQLTANNTLTGRYEYQRDSHDNEGISTFTLPSQAYNSRNPSHNLQISDTQVLSPRVINESRFQYARDLNENLALDNSPTINVQGAFVSGGNSIGTTSDTNSRYEFQNYTSMAIGKHFIKFGGRLRASRESNLSTSGFNGTFLFDSLSAYQAANPAQFLRTFGTPEVQVNYVDAGLYAEDDWRLRPNFTLSYGVRFESQNQIGDHADFAPRIGFAWGLGSGKTAPKTVLRAGFGLFYDRFGQNLVLQSIRQNGVNQVQYISSSDTAFTPAAFYPAIPDQNSPFLVGSSASIRKIDPNLRSPYLMQTAITLERQLAKTGTASVTYLNSRGEDSFISQNINAPLFDGTRPLGGTDNIYQYESAGTFRQNQLIANVRMNTPRFSIFSFYMLNFAKSDTAGASSFPSEPYNIGADFGRASFDVRNRFVFGGSFNAPYHFSLSPFMIANSGQPFNITLGQDLNGDSIFNDRPTFATDLNRPSVVSTTWGTFDRSPIAGQKLIPINYGTAPASFTLNMRLSKVFGFGKERGKGANVPGAGGGGGEHRGPGPMMGGRGPGGGGPFGGGGQTTNRRYNLTLSAQAMNILNHVNYGTQVGNLSSPFFGVSKTLAGGPFGSNSAVRRVFLQAQFAF
jgi:hypothetical protein